MPLLSKLLEGRTYYSPILRLLLSLSFFGANYFQPSPPSPPPKKNCPTPMIIAKLEPVTLISLSLNLSIRELKQRRSWATNGNRKLLLPITWSTDFRRFWSTLVAVNVIWVFHSISLSFRFHSGSFRYHSGLFRYHSVSFRFIPVSFRSIPVSFRFIPVHSGSFRLIPFHSVPFLCLVKSQNIGHVERQKMFLVPHFSIILLHRFKISLLRPCPP